MPIDHTTGIKQSGAITLGGSANQKSSGANNDFAGSNIGSEFLGHTAGNESTSMSELYRSTNSHTKTGGQFLIQITILGHQLRFLPLVRYPCHNFISQVMH